MNAPSLGRAFARLTYRTLAKISPGYMTVGEWCSRYAEIIGMRPYKEHTKNEHRIQIQHIIDWIGLMPLCHVKPVHIARMQSETWESGRCSAARRLVYESRVLFAEAINAGIIHTNPAEHVKLLPYRIQRSRLSLDVWQRMMGVAARHPQRWIAPMLKLALVTGQRRADLAKMTFDDVHDGYLYVEQQKTGARVALPLALRLDAIGLSIGDVIDQCRDYKRRGKTMLRDAGGRPLSVFSLSTRFRETLITAMGGRWNRAGTTPPTLHECRSLAERLYRAQGIDTQTLLGHKRQSMTDKYNDDRGLDRDKWKVLRL